MNNLSVAGLMANAALPEKATLLSQAIPPASTLSLSSLMPAADLQLATIDWPRLVSTELGAIKPLMAELSGSYTAFLRDSVQGLSVSSLWKTPYPAVELFTAADALTAFAPIRSPIKRRQTVEVEVERQREKVSADVYGSLPALLSKLGPDLLPMWQGANEASTLRHPDQARHVLISLRTLLEQVLHRLSPDNEVRAWSTEPTHFQQGRPTRAARVAFICREINSGPLTGFLDKDMAVHVCLLNLLQRVHQSDVPFTVKQQQALLTRCAATIGFLIRVVLDID